MLREWLRALYWVGHGAVVCHRLNVVQAVLGSQSVGEKVVLALLACAVLDSLYKYCGCLAKRKAFHEPKPVTMPVLQPTSPCRTPARLSPAAGTPKVYYLPARHFTPQPSVGHKRTFSLADMPTAATLAQCRSPEPLTPQPRTKQLEVAEWNITKPIMSNEFIISNQTMFLDMTWSVVLCLLLLWVKLSLRWGGLVQSLLATKFIFITYRNLMECAKVATLRTGHALAAVSLFNEGTLYRISTGTAITLTTLLAVWGEPRRKGPVHLIVVDLLMVWGPAVFVLGTYLFTCFCMIFRPNLGRVRALKHAVNRWKKISATVY